MAHGERGDLGQHHFGDEGQIERAGSACADPVQMRQFIRGGREIVGVARDMAGIDQEETRVEAAGAARRRDGAEDEAQGGGIGRGEGQTRFLDQFAQGGGGQCGG